MDGTGSYDPAGDPLTYRWAQVAGPGVTLYNKGSKTAFFTAPQDKGDVTRVFQLVVNDRMDDSEPDTVSITVKGIYSKKQEGQ